MALLSHGSTLNPYVAVINMTLASASASLIAVEASFAQAK